MEGIGGHGGAHLWGVWRLEAEGLGRGTVSKEQPEVQGNWERLVPQELGRRDWEPVSVPVL